MVYNCDDWSTRSGSCLGAKLGLESIFPFWFTSMSCQSLVELCSTWMCVSWKRSCSCDCKMVMLLSRSRVLCHQNWKRVSGCQHFHTAKPHSSKSSDFQCLVLWNSWLVRDDSNCKWHSIFNFRFHFSMDKADELTWQLEGSPGKATQQEQSADGEHKAEVLGEPAHNKDNPSLSHTLQWDTLNRQFVEYEQMVPFLIPEEQQRRLLDFLPLFLKVCSCFWL